MNGLGTKLPADDRSLEEAHHHDDLYTDPTTRNYDELEWSVCVKQASDILGADTFVNHNPHAGWGNLYGMDEDKKFAGKPVDGLENSIMPGLDELMINGAAKRERYVKAAITEMDKIVKDVHAFNSAVYSRFLHNIGFQPPATVTPMVMKHRKDGSGNTSKKDEEKQNDKK